MLRELIAACNRYLDGAPRDFITFEYVMLEDVNDGEAHARELVAFSKKVSSKFNLIPFNPFPRLEFKRSPERIRRFAEVLQRGGLPSPREDARRRYRGGVRSARR